jgi:hypothetical protein
MRARQLEVLTRIGTLSAVLATPFGCSLLIDDELEGLQQAPADVAGAPVAGSDSKPRDADVHPPQGGVPGSGGEGGGPGPAGEGGAHGPAEEGGAPSSTGEGDASGSAGQGNAATTTWETLPGLARDIAHGADGSVWTIGTDPVGYGDLSIAKWAGSTWVSANGGGVRIAVGPNGAPWTVNAKGEFYRHNSDPNVGTWQLQPGRATDISVGTDGSVWIVAANDLGNNDFGICKWNGTACEGTDGGAVRIAVAPDAVPWIVNTAGDIYRRTSSSPTEGYWQAIPGQARDIAAGADGSVWIISAERVGLDDFRIAVWDEQPGGGQWVSADGAGIAISVDPSGAPWVVNAAGQIQRFRGELKRTLGR